MITFRFREASLAGAVPAARAVLALVVAVSFAGARAAAGEDHMAGHHACCAPAAAETSAYARSTVEVAVPDVTLVEASGREVALREVLAGDAPIMLDFIFTSCTTICPVLTAAFAQVDGRLEDGGEELRLVSISIDPERDTPARLSDYAEQHGAGSRWRFFTGAPEAVKAVQRAFGADRGSKFNHAPLTFVRKAGEHTWLRLEGLGDAEGLWAEYQRSDPAR